MKNLNVLVALLAVSVGCGGSSSPVSSLDVGITSHGDRDHVVGVILLRGYADGGSVEVALDDGPFLPVPGKQDWTCEMDTKTWTLGWHTIQARIRSGAQQALARVNLYAAEGYDPEPPVFGESPPPVTTPTPPVVTLAPTQGLVARWSFDDGTAADSSPNKLDGTILGGATITDGVLDLDGTDDKVYIPAKGVAAPPEIANLAYGTISVRFKLEGIDTSTPAVESGPLFYMGSDEASSAANGSDSVSIYISHGHLFIPKLREIYFTVLSKGSVALCFDTIVSIEQGKWYTYTVSIGPDSHSAYLNGEAVQLNYNAGTKQSDYGFFKVTNDPDILAIGYHHFGVSKAWWHFNGKIDDVLIYDRVLSDAEVSVLANLGEG